MINMTLQKTYWIILGLVVGLGLILSLAIVEIHNNPGNFNSDLSTASGSSTVQGGLGTLKLETTLPDTPASIPMYTVTSVDDMVDGSEAKALSVKKSVPTADDAPALAEKGLEKYGGLPKDAQLDIVVPNYVTQNNLKTGSKESSVIGIQVFYKQVLNGLPVMGSRINIHLGENGEIIEIYKTWVNCKKTGDVKVISSQKAFEKLKNSEITTKPQGNIADGTIIKDVKIGYELYRPGTDKNETYLTPVWIFYLQDPRDSMLFPLRVSAQDTS